MIYIFHSKGYDITHIFCSKLEFLYQFNLKENIEKNMKTLKNDSLNYINKIGVMKFTNRLKKLKTLDIKSFQRGFS